METVTLTLLEFSELKDHEKQAVIEYYKKKILPDLVDWECRLVYEDAKMLGVFLYYVDLEKVRGKFEESPDVVFRKVVEGGLVSETDSKYKELESWYKDISNMDLMIKEYNDSGHVEDAKRLLKKRDMLYDDWKGGLLRLIERRYESNLKNEYEYMLTEEYIQDFLDSNGYVFRIFRDGCSIFKFSYNRLRYVDWIYVGFSD